MKRMLVFVALLFLLSGCTTPRDHQAANQLMEKIHGYWQEQQWDAMLGSYDKVFFRGKGKAEWRQELLSYDKSLGSLDGMKLISSQVDARYSGDFYIYSFRLHFEHGDLREVLTIYKPLNEAHVSIVGHVLTKVKGS